MAAHPTDPNILFGVVSTIFYRSTDAGATWSTFSFGTNTIGYDLAVNPLNPDVIYSGGYKYDGAYWKLSCMKSTDMGATWTATQLDTASTAYGYSCAIDPVDTTVVYVGGYAGSTTAFYKSTDCGATWTRATFPANYYYVYSIFVSPTDHNIVFAGCLQGICRSTDAGETWTRQATCSYNYRLAAAPDNPDIMYSAAYNNVYRSTDAGMTWTASGAGLVGSEVRTVLTVPGQSGTVFSGTTAGMLKSTDYGATWSEANRGILVGSIPVIAIDPRQPGGVQIQFKDNAVFSSTDNGDNWLRQPVVLSCGNVCNICFEPANPERMWMFEGGG
jgi:photosystem II stability/assembly factor-like uncharacterized protein